MLRLDGNRPIRVSEKIVRRIMREDGLKPVLYFVKSVFRFSSLAFSGFGIRRAGRWLVYWLSVLPNMPWVTDVTRFAMDGYKCRLSPVVDRFDGMGISRTLSRSPDAGMADRILLDVVATLKDGGRPVVRSGRGCRCRWPGWIHIREENDLTRSMSAKGRGPDNTAAEGFFGRLRNGFYHGRDWKGVGYDEFHRRLTAYLTHYNETGIRKPLGWMSPVQYHRSLGMAA